MLPEEITSFIGKDGGTRTFEVEKGAIRKFADAVDDQNLLYWDDEYARNSKYGNITAPPGFFGWPAKWTKAHLCVRLRGNPHLPNYNQRVP